MKKIFLIVSILLFASTIYLSTVLTKQWRTDVNSQPSTANISIIDFEFANGQSLDTISNALYKTHILKTAVAKQLSTDNIYIISYVLFFTCLCLYFMQCAKKIFPAGFYVLIIICAALMGLLDFFENRILLENSIKACCYKSCLKFTFPKFLLVGFVLIASIYSIFKHMFSRK
jgi:hypothetical protein